VGEAITECEAVIELIFLKFGPAITKDIAESQAPLAQPLRSVHLMLGKEVEINSSPPPNKILPNGDPQANGPACEPVCAGAHTCKPICASASARDPRMYEAYVSPNGKGKRTAKATPAPSWADVARRG
jgi:hypothetical protein